MFTFPKEVFRPASERWVRMGVSIAGGIPTAGAPGQSRTDGGGFWMCWMTDIWLDTPEELKAARQWDGLIDGGVNPLIIPAYQEATRPVGAGPGDVVACVMAAPSPLRGTFLQVQWTGGYSCIGGEGFSITHATKGKRFYEVRQVGSVVAGAQVLVVVPPLREAVTNEALDFNTPGCVMRLANPDDWLSAIDSTHSMTANPIWIEDLSAA